MQNWLDDNLEETATWFDRSLALSPNYAFAVSFCATRAFAHIVLADYPSAAAWGDKAIHAKDQNDRESHFGELAGD